MPPRDLEPLIVLTGAGISAESGIPTYRGAGGLWQGYRPQDLATPEAFHRDPDLAWRFYRWRRRSVAQCSPNAAHRLLAQIEERVSDFSLITQNVDGLHQAAGSQTVIELHGSIWRLRCTDCGAIWEARGRLGEESLPRCNQCGGLARPDVIWFGEPLDDEVLQMAMQSASRARTMVIIGTSAVVQPAAQLPLLARQAGAHLVEINLETTPISSIVDEHLEGAATVSLQRWWAGILAS